MINLHALDTFAIDHLQFDVRCSRCLQTASISTPATDEQVFCGLEQIRSLVMSGRIDEAWTTCLKVCSGPLEDPRPQLNVRLHKLFELIHAAESIPKHKKALHGKAIGNALRYSQDLAAFALDAFPEAYGIFTESMMLFAFPERTIGEDVILEKRKKLADDLVSLARMTARARESCLSFLMRYLLLIFAQFQPSFGTTTEEKDEDKSAIRSVVTNLLECEDSSQGVGSRITWRTDGPRPTPFSHKGIYAEADVQELPGRVNISRQESIASLTFADGDLDVALKNELGRIHVNRRRFRKMIVEYCAARGLDVFDTTHSVVDSDVETDFPTLSADQERIVVPAASVAPPTANMFSTMRKLRSLAKGGNFDTFVDTLRTADPTILETFPALSFRVGQCRMMSHICRGEYNLALNIAQTTLGPLAKMYPEFVPLLQGITTILVYSSDVKCTDGLPDLKKDMGHIPFLFGEVPEVHSSPSRAQSIEKKNPTMDVVEDGSTAHPCNDQKPESLLSFDDFIRKVVRVVVNSASTDAITLEAYKALEVKHGEPELVRLLKKLLLTHEEWQTQNVMTDRFAGLLGIDKLKSNDIFGGISTRDGKYGNVDEHPSRNAGGASTREARTNRDADRRREERREATILQIMEFLAMSRAEALSIVREHPNAENTQAILDSLLGPTV